MRAPAHVRGARTRARPALLTHALAGALIAWALAAPANANANTHAPADMSEHDGGETRVDAARPIDSDDDRVAVADAWLVGAPEDALAGALGMTLVHEGGPLSPVRPMVRGLSGARLSVAIGGLALADPATGLIDAALLPWAAVTTAAVESGASSGAAGALGGGLRLELLRGTALRARVLAGSLSTARASVGAAADGVLVAADAGTTRGDFTFSPTSAVAPVVHDLQVRGNNDHKRGSLLARALVDAGDLEVDALVLAAAHEGGIPGFATAPTAGLRGEDALAGARVAAAKTTAEARIGVALQARAARRLTHGPADPRSVIESGAARAQASLGARGALGTIDVVTGVSQAAVLASPFTRTAVDAGAAVHTTVGVVRLRAAADGALTTDVGALWGGELRAEMGDTWRAFAGVSRANRAPTLDELHAPRGIVNGNPALRPEALADVEVGGAVFALPRTRGAAGLEARAVAFAGRIDDAIAYINKNAFTIEPANVGSGWRAGADISMNVEPTEWLSIQGCAGVLASRLDVTGAPLPLAPPFASSFAIRGGAPAGPTATVVARSRAAAPSNTFGTLEAAPYTLFDLLLRAPVAPHLALGFAVQNALDATDARDANGMPLPGRLVFVSLEVSQ